MKEILDVIHKTIYQFFDVCGDDEEVPISDKDKLLLEVNKAICDNLKALDQESNTWSLDDAREDFMHDVYNTLDFLPTNEEANRIIDSFDRVTSSIEQELALDKIRAEIMKLDDINPDHPMDRIIHISRSEVLQIINKYR